MSYQVTEMQTRNWVKNVWPAQGGWCVIQLMPGYQFSGSVDQIASTTTTVQFKSLAEAEIATRFGRGGVTKIYTGPSAYMCVAYATMAASLIHSGIAFVKYILSGAPL